MKLYLHGEVMDDKIPETPWCPQCGPEPRCDEDGCCRVCGADCGMVPDWTAWKARAEKAELWIKTFLDATCLGDNIESVDPTEAAGIVNLWGFWSDRVEKMEATIARMNPVVEAAVAVVDEETTSTWNALCAAVEAAKEEKR